MYVGGWGEGQCEEVKNVLHRHMIANIRLNSEKFPLKLFLNSPILSQFKNYVIIHREKIVTIEKIFKDKPKINLNNRKLELFLNGVQLTQELDDGLYRIYNNSNFIGLGIVRNKLLKRDIVI